MGYLVDARPWGGPAGCGKTLSAMEFLVRGIRQFGEAGVFVAFEETRDTSVGMSVGVFDPSVVILDPISDLMGVGTGHDVSSVLTRQVDLKAKGVNAMYMRLGSEGQGGPDDRIAGPARAAQEAQERADAVKREEDEHRSNGAGQEQVTR